jgi:hypothetical protein
MWRSITVRATEYTLSARLFSSRSEVHTEKRFEEKPILSKLRISSILRSGDASPGALILLEKPVRSQPERISWQLKMLLQTKLTKLIAGSPRQRLILERLEPCEGKLSRTVLRGGLSGQPLQAYSVRSSHGGVPTRSAEFPRVRP